MAIQASRFRCTGKPDFKALRQEMSVLDGVKGLAVNSHAAGVTIHWEDTTVTSEHIELILNALGYRKCRSI